MSASAFCRVTRAWPRPRRSASAGVCLCAATFVLFGCEPPPGHWESIGPTSLDVLGYPTLYTGRAVTLAVNPFNPDDVWLGAATGGVWHTTNLTQPGVVWEPLTDAAPSLATGAIALDGCDATRCNLVWVGTGENGIRRDTYGGAGLLKIQWNPTASRYTTTVVSGTEERFRGGAINRVLIDGAALYVSVSVGKTASASSATVRAPEPPGLYGIHRSPDQGITWELIGQFPGGAPPTDLERVGTTMYAGVLRLGIFALLPTGEWCPLNPGVPASASCAPPVPTLPNPVVSPFDHVEIEVAPSDPNVIYAVFGKCVSETFLCSVSPEFYRSEDGGAGWIKTAAAVAAPGVIGTYSRYTHLLTINPAFSRILNYGGIELWESGDKADSFNNAWRPPHPDQHQLVYADLNNRYRRYLANDGGVYWTNSTIPQWHDANYGLPIVQFYSLASQTIGNGSTILLGGTQDNGSLFFTGSSTGIWEQVLGGDGGDAAIRNESILYASVDQIMPFRSVNGGGSFQEFWGGFGASDQSMFTPPYVQHRATEKLFFGTDRLYMRDPDVGVWNPVSPKFATGTEVYPDIERTNAITAIGLAKSTPQRIYVSLYDGAIWRTRDGLGFATPCAAASCWMQIAGPGSIPSDDVSFPPPPNAVPTSLDVDPIDPNIVYVTYSGFSNVAKVWRSVDGGGHWSSLAENLPVGLPVNVIRVDPQQVGTLWLGTDRGMFYRSLTAAMDWYLGWQPYGPSRGMPNVPVYDIVVDETTHEVVAATHGRGVFKLLIEPVIEPAIQLIHTPATVAGVIVSGMGFRDARGERCSLRIVDHRNRVVVNIPADASNAFRSDSLGHLVRDDSLAGRSRPYSLLCRDGKCRDLVSSRMPAPGDVMHVRCGSQAGQAVIPRASSAVTNPPSGLLLVARGDTSGSARIRVAAIALDSIGNRLPLCAAETVIPAGDNTQSISERIRRDLTKICSPGAATSREILLQSGGGREDPSRPLPFLSVREKTLRAKLVILAAQADPGNATGLSIEMDALRGHAARELVGLQVDFSTMASGAEGGSVRFVERSSLGRCDVTVRTFRGETAAEIVNSIRVTVMTMKQPGILGCESRQNPFDLVASRETLRTVMARGLLVEIKDRGVGVSLGPEDERALTR